MKALQSDEDIFFLCATLCLLCELCVSFCLLHREAQRATKVYNLFNISYSKWNKLILVKGTDLFR
jgi:hypothetical protein